MSFGINGPDNHLPAIQKSHHTNDGGAGNLGYFNQGKKKKDDEDEQDIFEFSNKEKKDDILMEELDSIGTRIKGFWKSLKSGFNDAETELSKTLDMPEIKESDIEQKNPEE